MAIDPDQSGPHLSRNHAETVRELTLQADRKAEVFVLPNPTDDQRQILVLPTTNGGFHHVDLTPAHTLSPPKPTFVNQAVKVQDQNSLEYYVNRFKNGDTMIFADMDHNIIGAIIDYHRAPLTLPNYTLPKAEILQHSVTLRLPHSEEWKIWNDIDGKMLNQLTFVRFLEENATDVSAPATADLIEVCRDVQGLRNVEFTSVVRADSNNAEKFHYSDTSGTRGKGEVEIPKEFTLEIPVYFNDRPYTIRALLRNEIDDGKLKLGIKLWRKEYVRQTAFRNIMAGVSTNTSIEVLFGDIPSREID